MVMPIPKMILTSTVAPHRTRVFEQDQMADFTSATWDSLAAQTIV
jgi:hypothetical protein